MIMMRFVLKIIINFNTLTPGGSPLIIWQFRQSKILSMASLGWFRGEKV